METGGESLGKGEDGPDLQERTTGPEAKEGRDQRKRMRWQRIKDVTMAGILDLGHLCACSVSSHEQIGLCSTGETLCMDSLQ